MSNTKTRIKNGFMAAVAAMLSICMAVSLFSACGEASFLKLDKSAATMYVGDSLTLVATTDKTDAEIVWSSDATHIATVSGGVVTAVSAGEVTIKAKSGGVKATCDITVIEKQEEKPDPKPDPDLESPVWHRESAASCLQAGNIEYWTKGGKYYADEECTREIAQSDTVLDALGHDFAGGEYMSDESSHWKKCSRADCGAVSGKTAHSYASGVCVCGKQKPDPAPETAVRHTANAASCLQAGNIEYWTRGGKYYADAECTREIAASDTVIAALGHDFTYGEYMSDESSHWKKCSRTGCEAVSEKTAHSYSAGVCVCGKSESSGEPDPAPVGTPLEKKTNGEVRANPGKWYYHIDGTAGTDYVFSSVPTEYSDKSLDAEFSDYNMSKATNKFFYFRYQPDYKLGTAYTITFKATLSADGVIRYGAPAKNASGGSDYSAFKTTEVRAGEATQLTFEGSVNDVEPFSVRIDSVSRTNDVRLVVSDITVRSESFYKLDKLNKTDGAAVKGKWFYWADGDYALMSDPCFDNGRVLFEFAHTTRGATYQLRYHPENAVEGKTYIARFTVLSSAAANMSFCGGTSPLEDSTFAAGETKTLEYTFVAQTSTASPNPFYIQVKPTDPVKPISVSVSDVTFEEAAEKTIAGKYADYFRIGAAVQAGKLSGGYGDLMENFNSITLENSMKWKNLEGTEGAYTFNKSGDSADALIKWAKANGVGVRGHCLLWYKSLPAWLHDKFDGKEYSEELKASALGYIDRNIENVMEHFGDDVYVWDVVNEALYNSVTASKLSDTSKGVYGDIWRTNDNMSPSSSDWVDWYKVCGGYEYIAHAFKKADEVRKANDLSVELYYNDYGLNDPYKRQACLNLVQMLRDSGAPIDGIGMQAHYKLDSYTANKTTWLKNFEDSVKAFIDAGLDVQITELDIRFEGELTEELEREQGEMFGKIFEICRKYAKTEGKAHGVTGVTTWGVQDGCNGAWTDGKYPLVFGTDMQPKKAYYEIMNF